ncbi:efflux RND transporter periplasmic adaptor subunit [Rhodosalinus sp. K401]|uniref:efflux RND transporter periplasmic adaptor subunit n=1 Tax=Rhodosalinus sp. K401 TaxID=3239195 RepID=UPI003524B7A5
MTVPPPSILVVVFAGPLVALSVLAVPVAAQQEERGFECVIEPAVEVSIASPAGGLLAEISVERGDVVHAGQPIARLDSGLEETTVALQRERAESDAEIEAARARLRLARSQAERLATLVERSIAPLGDLEEAEASVEVASREVSMAEMRQRIAALELERAEELLRQRTIRSPLDGEVLERRLFTGEYASSDVVIARIAQLDPLHVEAYLPIEMYRELERGMRAVVRPGSPISGRHEGTVTAIDRVFDPASGTFGVRVELPNPDLAIPAGLRCLVSFAPEG